MRYFSEFRLSSIFLSSVLYKEWRPFWFMWSGSTTDFLGKWETLTDSRVFILFVMLVPLTRYLLLIIDKMNDFGLVWWSMWYIFYLEIINTEEEIEDFLWENLIILSNSRKLIFCSIVVEFEFNNSGNFN